MKTILGLDLGTNSIGWALVEQNFETKEGTILGLLSNYPDGCFDDRGFWQGKFSIPNSRKD